MGELRPADAHLTEMAARLRLTYTRDTWPNWQKRRPRAI